MLQLLKLRTALRLPADARASGAPHISPRSPNPHSSSPRKTPRKTSLSFCPQGGPAMIHGLSVAGAMGRPA